MMAFNHSLLGVTGCALALGTSDPKVLLVAGLVAQFPDVDISTSYIGRFLFPVSRFIEYYFPHRTITHSLAATAFVSAVSAPLILYWSLPLYYQAVVLGYTLGWIGDTITKSGVAAFWPHQVRLVIPRNTDLRLETGSPAEYWIMAILVGLLAIFLNINSAGGILDSVTQILGQQHGAFEMYIRTRDTNLMLADVDGINLVSGKSVRGTFEIVDSEQQELIIKTQEGLLKTDEQLRPTSIKVRKGEPVVTRAEQLNLDDESPADALSRLGRIPSRTYISGELRFKDAEDLRIHKRVDTFNTMKAVDGGDVKSVKLKDASPKSVYRLLGEYEASGSLFVRMVYVQQQS